MIFLGKMKGRDCSRPSPLAAAPRSKLSQGKSVSVPLTVLATGTVNAPTLRMARLPNMAKLVRHDSHKSFGPAANPISQVSAVSPRPITATLIRRGHTDCDQSAAAVSRGTRAGRVVDPHRKAADASGPDEPDHFGYRFTGNVRRIANPHIYHPLSAYTSYHR